MTNLTLAGYANEVEAFIERTKKCRTLDEMREAFLELLTVRAQYRQVVTAGWEPTTV